MSENENVSGFDKAPGPDTFSVDQYIKGKARFPEFTHTVYLDQQAGTEMAECIEKYEAAAARIHQIEKEMLRITEAGSQSLVDDLTSDLAEEGDRLRDEARAAEKRMKELEGVIRESGLTLHMRANTVVKFGSVVRRAEKEYDKKNGRGAADDIEYVTAKNRHIMIAQLSAYCYKISNPQGQSAPPLDKEGFASLVDSLIGSESMRLMIAISKGLDSSAEWASKIDAGFPGGVSDVAGERLGDSGTEDR